MQEERNAVVGLVHGMQRALLGAFGMPYDPDLRQDADDPQREPRGRLAREREREQGGHESDASDEPDDDKRHKRVYLRRYTIEVQSEHNERIERHGCLVDDEAAEQHRHGIGERKPQTAVVIGLHGLTAARKRRDAVEILPDDRDDVRLEERKPRMQLVDQYLHAEGFEQPVDGHSRERDEQEPIVEPAYRLERLRAFIGDEKVSEQHHEGQRDEDGVEAAAGDARRLGREIRAGRALPRAR